MSFKKFKNLNHMLLQLQHSCSFSPKYSQFFVVFYSSRLAALYFVVSASYLCLSLTARAWYLDLSAHLAQAAPNSLPISGTFILGFALSSSPRLSLAKHMKAVRARLGAFGSLVFFFLPFGSSGAGPGTVDAFTSGCSSRASAKATAAVAKALKAAAMVGLLPGFLSDFFFFLPFGSSGAGTGTVDAF